jgi:hypothetical protein
MFNTNEKDNEAFLKYLNDLQDPQPNSTDAAAAGSQPGRL